ncbi:MAG: hypothetical protein DI629_14100 [Mesorhizobium amorphae]|nr:MAG: hypothetical protein DI629_14100 [Mesorhizobium amorphae]
MSELRRIEVDFNEREGTDDIIIDYGTRANAELEPAAFGNRVILTDGQIEVEAVLKRGYHYDVVERLIGRPSRI